MRFLLISGFRVQVPGGSPYLAVKPMKHPHIWGKREPVMSRLSFWVLMGTYSTLSLDSSSKTAQLEISTAMGVKSSMSFTASSLDDGMKW
jgi:hypothetical protein